MSYRAAAAIVPRSVGLAGSTVFVLAGIVLSVPAFAQVAPVGPEFQVNTYTTSVQGYWTPSVASAADGSFVVVWDSYEQDGSGFGVFGQRFDASGATQGTEFQVNTYTTSDQGGYSASVASAPDGSFVVVWDSYGQDGSGFGVFGQRFDASGATQGTEFQVNTYTTSAQGFASVGSASVSVASAADGSFVVVWDSLGQDGSGFGVFGQRFDASGATQGTEFQVNTYTTSAQGSGSVSVASAADGSFVVVWDSYGQDGDDRGVFGQRFDASGATQGSEFQVNTYTTSFQGYSMSVASAADGSFVVAWDGGGQDGDGTGVFGQRFDASGATQGSEFQVNTYTTSYQGYSVSVASAADGSFVVVWDSLGQDGDGTGVFGQRFDASGATQGSEFQVNTYTTSYQGYSMSVASAADGGFVVVWDGDGQDGSSSGLFGQRFSANFSAKVVCPVSPEPSCLAAAQAKLQYSEKKAGKEKMKMQWKKIATATTQHEFGDPVASNTSVALCIYDNGGNLVQGFSVDRAGQQCAGKDCWKAKGTNGYGYKDKDNSSDGISKIGYVSGTADKGKADAKGKNNTAKNQTALPTGVVSSLTGNTTPRIQILTSNGLCIGATMNDVQKDAGGIYKARLK